MATLWIVFTMVHGPTSFNENRDVLGRSTHFWGSLLGGPPNLLVALGLILLYSHLTRFASRLARVGYALTVLGLVVPAGIDLVIGALGAPFFVPILGIGVILIARGNRHNSHLQLQQQNLLALMLMGISLGMAFVCALVPQEVSDPIGGYRVFGLLAYFVPGICWGLFGAGFWKMP